MAQSEVGHRGVGGDEGGGIKMGKEKIYNMGLIGVTIGLVITLLGVGIGLILGLNDSEIINIMSIGLVVFLGGMILVTFYLRKKVKEDE